MVGRIYKGLYWIHSHFVTKHCKTQIYKSSRPHGSIAEDLNVFSYCRSMGANGPQGVASLDPREIIGMIYVGYH